MPVGIYAAQALRNLGVWAAAESRLARAENVRAALLLALALTACATPQPPNPYTQAPPPQHALVAHSPMADLLFGALIFVLF